MPVFVDALPGGNGSANTSYVSVDKCQRCGQRHDKIPLKPVSNPFACRLPDPSKGVTVFAPMNFYALCPDGGGPIMFRQTDEAEGRSGGGCWSVTFDVARLSGQFDVAVSEIKEVQENPGAPPPQPT